MDFIILMDRFWFFFQHLTGGEVGCDRGVFGKRRAELIPTRSGAAQAGQGQGWAAVTLLTERSRPNSPGTTGVLGVFGVTSVRNDTSSPSCTAHKASSCVLFVSTPLHFVWKSFETCSLHSSFFSAVLLRGIVFLSLRSLHF